MNKEPSVAIIIVNWNGKYMTDECLESLKKLSYPNYSVILVDNGSVDGSVVYFKKHYPDVNIIEHEKNLGFTGGCNAGIRKALKQNAGYVLLLNNDTIVNDANFLMTMVKAIDQDDKIGMACPTIYGESTNDVWYAGGKLSLWTGWGHDHQVPASEKVQRTGYATGCCLLVKSKVITNIGLLNEAYFLSVEDVEWCARARQFDWETAYIPAAKILHKESQSSRSAEEGFYSPTRIYYEFRNSIWFIREYGNILQKYVIWPVHFCSRYLYKISAYILLGRWQKFKAVSRAMIDGIFSKGKNFKTG